MRKIQPQRTHVSNYPTMQLAWHVNIFGISLLLGFFPLIFPSSALADPIRTEPPPRDRIVGIMPNPIPVSPPPVLPPPVLTPPVSPILSEVIPWSITVPLNNNEFIGLNLQIVSVPGEDIHFLLQQRTLLNSAIEAAVQNQTCQYINPVQLGEQIRDQLNTLAPGATEPIAGVSIILNFCERLN